MDLEEDRFDVTYDAARVATDALLDAIRKLEYEPVVVESTPGASKSGATQVIWGRFLKSSPSCSERPVMQASPCSCSSRARVDHLASAWMP